MELLKIFDEAKNITDLSRKLFNSDSTKYRELAKKELLKHGIIYDIWKKDKKSKNKKYCIQCGKELTRGQKKFCSSSCAATYNNLQRGKKEKKCLYCNNTIHRGSYCNNTCYAKYKNDEYIKRWLNGEESGTIGHCEIANAVRNYIFEKYNYQCQECGFNKINEYTNKSILQIHHIDGDCTNNIESNLKLLCPNCHALTENFGNRNQNSTRLDKRLKWVQKKFEKFW